MVLVISVDHEQADFLCRHSLLHIGCFVFLRQGLIMQTKLAQTHRALSTSLFLPSAGFKDVGNPAQHFFYFNTYIVFLNTIIYFKIIHYFKGHYNLIPKAVQKLFGLKSPLSPDTPWSCIWERWLHSGFPFCVPMSAAGKEQPFALKQIFFLVSTGIDTNYELFNKLFQRRETILEIVK